MLKTPPRYEAVANGGMSKPMRGESQSLRCSSFLLTLPAACATAADLTAEEEPEFRPAHHFRGPNKAHKFSSRIKFYKSVGKVFSIRQIHRFNSP